MWPLAFYSLLPAGYLHGTRKEEKAWQLAREDKQRESRGHAGKVAFVCVCVCVVHRMLRNQVILGSGARHSDGLVCVRPSQKQTSSTMSHANAMTSDILDRKGQLSERPACAS